jgi:hypothetical protein
MHARRGRGSRRSPCADSQHVTMSNSAFVFAKPHANTTEVQALIKKTFDDKGITIVEEGEIDGPTIDSKK